MSKYIVYKHIPAYMFTPETYKRYELKTKEELKDFLFKNQDNLKELEIFNKTDNCKINVLIKIGE